MLVSYVATVPGKRPLTNGVRYSRDVCSCGWTFWTHPIWYCEL